MSDKASQHTLLEDLEAIRNSLDTIAKSEPKIPTLEEIVGHRTPTSVNPKNPFLSSQSLSELIQIRNEAEARTAEELARMEPVRPVEDILRTGESPTEPEPEPTPDPEEILAQLETLFDGWVEHSVEQYLAVFESELRNRLQQDFRSLVAQWYQEHELPLPEAFTRPSADDPPEPDPES